MEFEVTNLTSTDLVPVEEYDSFPAEFILKSRAPMLRFARESVSELEILPSNKTVSKIYTADFAPQQLDETLETDYELKYQYGEEEIQTIISMGVRLKFW